MDDASFITALEALWATTGGKVLIIVGIGYLLLKQWGGQVLDFVKARMEAKDKHKFVHTERSHAEIEALRNEARQASAALVAALNERIDTLEAELSKAVEHTTRCDAELANLRADHRSLLERQSGLQAAFDIMRRSVTDQERP